MPEDVYLAERRFLRQRLSPPLRTAKRLIMRKHEWIEQEDTR